MSRRRSRTNGSRRRQSSQQKRTALLLLLFFGVVIAAGFMISAGNSNKSEHRELTTQGDLSKVKTAKGLDEKILNYEGMTVSFNPTLHIPNWVAWELTADEANGTEPRSNNFNVDPAVKGCADPKDYTRSGYDRGHMAPAGDMKWSPTAMEETFFMTNICPQDGSLNRGSWKKLEEKCRMRAQRDSAIIIVCGPVLASKPKKYIGETQVAVPESFFKVILSPYSDPPVAIGFIMPNGHVEGGMQQCAMSVDEVERITGHDFFYNLPDDIENAVESRFNFDRWSRMK